MEILKDISYLIYTQIFMGYGLVTLIVILLSLFFKNSSFIKKFDDISCKILIYSGLLYGILFTLSIIIFFLTADENAKTSTIDRMFGKYWFGYWLQPILWIILTQLHWLKKIREKKWLRFVMCFPLIFSFEAFVIITSSLHRDYLPSSWDMMDRTSGLLTLLLGIFGKITQYSLVVGLYFLIENSIKYFLKMKRA